MECWVNNIDEVLVAGNGIGLIGLGGGGGNGGGGGGGRGGWVGGDRVSIWVKRM